MRKVRHRGVSKVHWIFTLAFAAYNLVRMRIWPLQFRRRKSGPTCVRSGIDLEPEATKTNEIEPFDIING